MNVAHKAPEYDVVTLANIEATVNNYFRNGGGGMPAEEAKGSSVWTTIMDAWGTVDPANAP